MAVRKQGDRWIVEFMFRGNRIFRRLPKGRNKGDGQALETHLRATIFNTVDLGRTPDPPLRRIIEAWAKGKDDKQQSHVNAVLEHVTEETTLGQVTAVAEKIKESDLAAGTINRRLAVLKATAKYAKRKKWAERNLSPDIEMLPEPRYVRREVSLDMVPRLIRAASTPRAKALIAGSAYTGMRLSEVLRFDPAKDIIDGAIRVRDTKNGEDRMVPLLPALKPHLSQFPMDKSGWRNVYRGWMRAREKAGLSIRYHDLRHLVATAMVNAGRDLRTVGDILGHKSLQTTRKYTHPSLEAKRKALSAITSGLQRKGRGQAKKAA